MATIKKGILGGVSGKVGNVVGGSWKGISYLRTLPDSVNDAKTEKQLSTRLKLKMTMQVLQPCTEFIRIGYRAYAKKMTAFNAATSYLFHNIFTGDYPNFQIDFSKVLVSRGELTGGDNVACAASVAAKADFSWDDNSSTGTASADDVVMVMVYNPDKNNAVFNIQSAQRSDAAYSLSLPLNYSGDNVHCYLCFINLGAFMSSQAKHAISKSNYAGSITVL